MEAFHIRTAWPEDVPELAALFQDVFGETEAGLALFFSRAFSPERAVVAEYEGRVRGMFHILPAGLRCGGETLQAAYLYALAVSPALRGRGAAGRMMNFFDGFLPASGYEAAVLRPAEASLFGFYRRFGFDGTLLTREASVSPGGAAPARLSPAALWNLPGGRGRYFPDSDPFFAWETDMLRYAQDYAALSGMKAALIETPEETGYALYRREGDRLLAEEVGGRDRTALLRALCAAEGTHSAQARLPVTDNAPGAAVPTALIKWYASPRDASRGYFSLGLE